MTGECGGAESTAKWLDKNEEKSWVSDYEQKVIQDIEVSVNTEPKAKTGKGTGDERADTYKIYEVRNYLNRWAHVNTVISDKKMQPCSMKTVIHK